MGVVASDYGWIQAVKPGTNVFDLALNPSGGNIGIGTASPLDALHISSAVSSDYRGNLLLDDSTTGFAAGVGGQITFGAEYRTNGDHTEWAAIQGAKANSTDANYAGTLEFKTRAHGGALQTKMVLDEDGKVQIGGATTNGLLAIKGTGAYFDADCATNNNSGMRLYENGTFKWQLYNDGDAGDPFKIDTSSATAMVVTQSGDVLIGSGGSGPLTKAQIHTLGATISSGNAIKSSTMKGLTISNSGNGTESVGVWFGTNEAHWSGISGQRNDTGTWDTDLRFYTHEAATNDLTYSRERVRITGAGNVGIGIESPVGNLQVQGSSASTYTGAGPTTIIRASQSTAGAWIASDFDGAFTYMGNDSSTTGKFAAYNYATSAEMNMILGQNRMYIKSDGNVAIGNTSSPSAKLHLYTSGSEGINLGIQNNERYWKIETDGGLLTFTDVSAGLLHRLAINTSGYVGIGTTSPDGKLSVTSTTVDSEDVLYLKSGADSVGDYLGMAFEIGVGGNGPHGAVRVYGGPSGNDSYMSLLTTTDGGTLVQQMTIDHVGTVTVPNGDLLVNSTTAVSSFYNGLNDTGFGASSGGYTACVRSGTNTPLYVSTAGTGSGGFISMSQNGSERGAISYNGSVMVYGGTSDYRLKENVTPIANALTKVAALNPINFDWKESGDNSDGFLAHEAQTVIPYAVTGVKDEVNTDTNSGEEKTNGEPKYQMMDYAKLTPLLVKAIQELEEKLNIREGELEQRVHDLEQRLV
jgi:hypothetical protein